MRDFFGCSRRLGDHRRVVHVITSFDYGGVERRMQILARVSNQSVWQHHFCAIGRGGAMADNLEKMGVPVWCLQKPVRIPSPLALLDLYRLFRGLKPAVVHTHGAEANFHGLIAAWFAGVPVRIGEEIGIPDHSSRAKLVFRRVYGLANRVVGISDAVLNWLLESGEVPAGKATRIYNPVFLESFGDRSLQSSDVFRIGFVGRLERVKNPLALVDATALLIARGVPAELWLIGDGSQKPVIQERINELGLVKQVKLWGYQPNPVDYLVQCHIYVQPSLAEGFGIALVEAMGCGVPVIATAVGGAPEIIEHGKTGWLVDRINPEALACVLLDAWKQGEAGRRFIGEAARSSVKGRFVPEMYIAELDNLYTAVLSN